MPDSTQDQLRRAYELIKARQRQEAIQLLLPILKVDENNANAWWLLANAVDKPDDAREALQNVLRLRPDHEKAQQMLDKLNKLHPPVPEPEPEPAEDPFAFDDVAEEPADDLADVVTSSPAADPFGAPAQTFGAPASSAADDEPFGQAQTFGAPAPSGAGDDPFGPGAGSGSAERAQPRKPRPAVAADDDPFGGSVGAPAASRKASGGKRSTNPLVIILAVVGVLALCGCVGCFAVTQLGLFSFAAVGNAVVGTMEAGGFDMQGIMQTAEAGAPGMMETLSAAGIDINFAGDNSALPANAISKGQINYGDSRRENLGQGEQQAFTFSGNAGDRVLITMTADNTDNLDPFVALYNPENRQIASNDDDATSLNSLLEFQLPSAGTYTILARSFADSGSGAYTLQLQRR